MKGFRVLGIIGVVQWFLGGSGGNKVGMLCMRVVCLIRILGILVHKSVLFCVGWTRVVALIRLLGICIHRSMLFRARHGIC